MLSKKSIVQFFILSFLLSGFLFVSTSFAETPADPAATAVEATTESSSDHRSKVLSTFVGKQRGELVESFDERREQHKILFFMGITLLVFVLMTAGFGVSMAMLGKDVFVPHMICAGVSVFLSIAHAVVAVVWFFPF